MDLAVLSAQAGSVVQPFRLPDDLNKGVSTVPRIPTLRSIMKSRYAYWYAYGSVRARIRATPGGRVTVPYLAVTRNFVVTIAFSIGASRAPMPVRAPYDSHSLCHRIPMILSPYEVRDVCTSMPWRTNRRYFNKYKNTDAECRDSCVLRDPLCGP